MDIFTQYPDQKTPKQLLIFKPDIPTKEGEDEKKLIYSYSNQGRYSDIANLGLFQTMIGFFSKFSSPIKTVHMKNTKAFLYSPEPSFWISYTISEDVPMVDQTGIDLLKFLCDTFIFLTGSFTEQFNQSYEVFVFKLKKFFSTIMPTITDSMLTSPGRFTQVQNVILKLRELDNLRKYVGDFKSQFKCVDSFALFYNTQIIHTNLENDQLNIISTLFNELRNGTMDFGSKYNSIRTANDERRIIFGIPEERSRSKTSLAVTKDILNCPVYIDGKEKNWVIYEHKLFFFHFIIDVSNEQNIMSFILFLSAGLPEVFEGMLTPYLMDNVGRMPRELFHKNMTYHFINIERQTKFGSIALQGKKDNEILMNYLEMMKIFGDEIYVKDPKGKWIVYIKNNETRKMLEIIAQLSHNSSLSDCYRLFLFSLIQLF